MKWINKDLNKYLQAKEYIDTIIIPLQPFQFSDENTIEKDAFLGNLLSIYVNNIEIELSGRLFLLPSYTYVKDNNLENEVSRLNKWVDHVMQQTFKHVFFITCDMQWKKNEKDLNGELIWLPGASTVDISSSEAKVIIQNQVEQMSELIRSYWS